MNFRAPKAFVSVDVADATQSGLVEQQRFDAGFVRFQKVSELLFRNFERIGAEAFQLCRKIFRSEIGHSAEAPRVGIAELAAIIEEQAYVRVLGKRRIRRMRRKMAGHSQMNKQRAVAFVAVRALSGTASRQANEHKFAKTLDALNGAARQMFFEGSGIIDKIRFAKSDGDNAAADDGHLKAASDSLYFRKFGHKSKSQNLACWSVFTMAIHLRDP